MDIQTLIQGGAVGIAILLILLCFAYIRYREKSDKEERQSREKVNKEDRAVWTNHLSQIITCNAEANKELAISLARLTDGISNLGINCKANQEGLSTVSKELGTVCQAIGHETGRLSNETDRIIKAFKNITD